MERFCWYDKYCFLLHEIAGTGCLVCGESDGLDRLGLLCSSCYHELESEFLGFPVHVRGLSVLSLFEYSGIAKYLMQKSKFDHCRLSALVLVVCGARFLERSAWSADGCRLMVMPCSRRSFLDRGWDPASLFASHLDARRLPGGMLLRGRGRQQKRLGREQRLRAAQGLLVPGKKLSGLLCGGAWNTSILLVDDVMTTGATLLRASELLQEAGCGAGFLRAIVLCCD